MHHSITQVRNILISVPAPRANVQLARSTLRIQKKRVYSSTKRETSDEKDERESKPMPFGPPQPSSYTDSVSGAAAEANTRPLPFLSVPLGVSKRPTSDRPTWSERHAEWFDRDVRLEKRRLMYVYHLSTLLQSCVQSVSLTRSSIKEATRGYFHDFHEIRSHGGKTWRSPPTMIRPDVR